MKRVIGYVISRDNNFGNWVYKGFSTYYMAKVIGVFDKVTGEEIVLNRHFEPLSDKFAYRNEKIKKFRGLDVEEI